MRTVARVLGWVVSVLVLAVVVALKVAEQELPDLIDLPDWVSWTIVSAFGALFFAVVGGALVKQFGPKARQARRVSRQEAREKRRKLESFELE